MPHAGVPAPTRGAPRHDTSGALSFQPLGRALPFRRQLSLRFILKGAGGGTWAQLPVSLQETRPPAGRENR